MKLYLVTVTLPVHAEAEIEAENYSQAKEIAETLKWNDFEQVPSVSTRPFIDGIYPVAEALDALE